MQLTDGPCTTYLAHRAERSSTPVVDHVVTLMCTSPLDFCKLDGMRLLAHQYLEHPDPELRWRAAHLVGTCSQNVPTVQEQALALGCMRKLLRLLDHDPGEMVRIKALFAISCESTGRGQSLGSGMGQEHFPLQGVLPL